MTRPSPRNNCREDHPAAAIEVSGKRYEAAISAAVGSAMDALGIPGRGVRVELYKLLVYRPGDHFAPHRDSEKVNGMFGTLVVTLPGDWTGGDLVVSHGDARLSFDGRTDEAADLAWVAFYADCVHQIEPVTSGLRTALVYNVVSSEGQAEIPVGLDPEVDAARGVLRAFARLGEPKLVMPLEHDYTRVGLTFGGLKGADAGRASVLARAARLEAFDLHLGLIAIYECGSAEPTSWGRGYGRRYEPAAFAPAEVSDRSVTLEVMVPAPGQRFRATGGLAVEDYELSPPGALDQAPSDSIRFTESTGNEGASFVRAYRRAAFVLSPVSERGGLLAALPHAHAVATACSLFEQGERDLALTLADSLLESWPLHNEWSSHDSSLMYVDLDDDDESDDSEDDNYESDDSEDDHYESGDDAPTNPYRQPSVDANRHLVESRALVQPRFLDLVVKAGELHRVIRFLGQFRTTGQWLGDEGTARQSGEALGRAYTLAQVASVEPIRNILTAIVGQSPSIAASVASGLISHAPSLGEFAGRVLVDELVRVALTPRPENPWRQDDDHNNESASWHRSTSPSGPMHLAALLRFVAAAAPDAARSGLLALARPARTGPYALDRDIVPALVLLANDPTTVDDPTTGSVILGPLSPLANALRCILAERVAVTLSPPADQTRAFSCKCKCVECAAVSVFMASPIERQWTLKAVEHRRRHVESSVSAADVDKETLRVGSPHTLRLTKNTASYARRVAAQTRDRAAMAALSAFQQA